VDVEKLEKQEAKLKAKIEKHAERPIRRFKVARTDEETGATALAFTRLSTTIYV